MEPKDQAHYAESKLYDDVGRYLLLFQSLESYLDRMLTLAIGLGRYNTGRAIISKLSNRGKIDVLNAAVLGSGVKAIALAKHPEWLVDFRNFIKACEEEGEIRNSLAHGNFIYDAVKYGGPVLNNRNSVGRHGIRVRIQEVTHKSMKKSLLQISKLCMDANFMHVQLAAWYIHFDQETHDAHINDKISTS